MQFLPSAETAHLEEIMRTKGRIKREPVKSPFVFSAVKTVEGVWFIAWLKAMTIICSRMLGIARFQIHRFCA